jgi:hypothetical protein
METSHFGSNSTIRHSEGWFPGIHQQLLLPDILCNIVLKFPILYFVDLIDVFLQETTFIEQVVEDESQMEGIPPGCSRIMNWHLHLEAHHFVYPRGWLLQKNLDVVLPIK